MDKIYYPEDSYRECFELEENSYWFQHRNKIIKIALETYGTNKNIVDIGGGNGFMSIYLQNHGFNMTLIEPGTVACENARRRGVKNVIHGTISDFKSESSIEHAICCDVIEHIKKPVVFLSEIYAKLKPGGILVLTAPAFQFLWSHSDEEAHHFKRYTTHSLHKLAQENNFQLLYSSYFFSYLFFPVLFFRTLPFKLFKIKSVKHFRKRRSKEHNANHSSFIINIFNKIETILIQLKKHLFFGSSVIIILKKN